MAKAAKEKPKTQMEKLLLHFEEYVKITTAIVEDFIGGPGMKSELQIANDNFFELLQSYADDPEELEFKDLFKQLKEIDFGNEEAADLIEFLKDNWENVNVDDVLALADKVDDNAIYDKVSSKGWASIKIDNLRDAEKLRDFVQREIYPAANDSFNYNI